MTNPVNPHSTAASAGAPLRLKIEGLKKRYATGAWAVADVSLTARSGEFIVMLGPSGCGKTTTLRCIAGLETPEEGLISVGGVVVDDPARRLRVPTQKRQIGMVFQSYAIWPHMSVHDNVAFPLRLRQVSSAEVRARVAAALDMVGLGAKSNRSATALSGGEQQRVALARALVYDPKLLLLDEPLSNLDAELRLYLRAELREIQRRSGVTAIYVTHDQTEAMALGDRVAVLNMGRVEQIAAPEVIYHRPASAFVAKFTGFGNLVAARVQEVSEGYAFAKTAEGMMFKGTPGSHLVRGQQVFVCFRPENLQLTHRAVFDAANTWPATIRSQQFLGAQTQFIVRVCEQELSASATGLVGASMADGLFVRVDPDTVVILPDGSAPSVALLPQLANVHRADSASTVEMQ